MAAESAGSRSAVAVERVLSRLQIATFAPSARKRSAMAAPIPVEPPVTIARLPLRSAMSPPLNHKAPRERVEGLEPHRSALALQAGDDPRPLAFTHRQVQLQRPEEIA